MFCGNKYSLIPSYLFQNVYKIKESFLKSDLLSKTVHLLRLSYYNQIFEIDRGQVVNIIKNNNTDVFNKCPKIKIKDEIYKLNFGL